MRERAKKIYRSVCVYGRYKRKNKKYSKIVKRAKEKKIKRIKLNTKMNLVSISLVV